MYQVQKINDKRRKIGKETVQRQAGGDWRDARKTEHFFYWGGTAHQSSTEREKESVTKRQKDGRKWVGMSPFILPPLPPLTPVKSCHYMCRLMPDKLVQQHVIVNCKWVLAWERKCVSVMDRWGGQTKSCLKMLHKISRLCSLLRLLSFSALCERTGCSDKSSQQGAVDQEGRAADWHCAHVIIYQTTIVAHATTVQL